MPEWDAASSLGLAVYEIARRPLPCPLRRGIPNPDSLIC
jgi:hypothetical protein